MIINPVVVDMDVGKVDPIPMEVSSDGTIEMEVGSAIQIVRVNLQEREATPTQETQVIVADAEYDGLSRVIVKPIPSNYGLVAWDGSILTVS